MKVKDGDLHDMAHYLHTAIKRQEKFREIGMPHLIAEANARRIYERRRRLIRMMRNRGLMDDFIHADKKHLQGIAKKLREDFGYEETPTTINAHINEIAEKIRMFLIEQGHWEFALMSRGEVSDYIIEARRSEL